MKRNPLAMYLLALLAATGTAQAGPIQVNLGGMSTPIPVWSYPSWSDGDGSIIRNDVQISYNPKSNGNSAFIGDDVIWGGTDGVLRFDFHVPATTLQFQFELSGEGRVGPALEIFFSNSNHNRVTVPLASDPFAVYSLTFNGAAFDNAEMNFSLGEPGDHIDFTVTGLQYGTGVPEPSTLALLATGLLGFGGRRALSWKRKRSTAETNVNE